MRALLLVALGNAGFAPVLADATAVPSLTISQLKITSSNGQFVTLYNSTNSPLNMGAYQLEYFNNFDISKATSSKLVPLSGTLPPHGFYMISDDTLPVCYQMTIMSTSLSFSSTAGMVALLSVGQAAPGGLPATNIEDYVGWSKTAASGAQTLPAAGFLQRQPLDAAHNPVVAQAGSGSWQPMQYDSADPCKLVTSGGSTTPQSTNSALLPSVEPPATVVADVAGGAAPHVPAADMGLHAPQLTELLPNPDGTGTDATEEFIELYNDNSVPFDLSGFIVQAGLTTARSYVVPDGTLLPAKQFVAMYAPATKLTLSNSGSQVTPADPLGAIVSTAETYGTAADGQAWALANGAWHWTTQPTPNAANVIKAPVSKTTKTTTSVSTQRTAAKPATSKSAKTTSKPAASKFVAAAVGAVPIHLWQLALVGSAAVVYGVYEYRTDLRNRLRKLRAKLGFGKPTRQPTARRRDNRTGE